MSSLNWRGILKDARLDTSQDTAMTIKPEEQNKDCLRVIKTLIRELKRFYRKYDGYKSDIPSFENESNFYIGNKVTEKSACELIRTYLNRTEGGNAPVFEGGNADDLMLYRTYFDFDYQTFKVGRMVFYLYTIETDARSDLEDTIDIDVRITVETEEELEEVVKELRDILRRVLG